MNNPQPEEWKDIPIDYDCPSYEISDLGHIRRKKDERIMSFRIEENGTAYCQLRDKDGKKCFVKVETVVAKVFIPNPNNFKFVGNTDGNPHNRAAQNLVWQNNKKGTKRKTPSEICFNGTTTSETRTAERRYF
jgi:hypothetical protein